ncbi:DUF456 domain-containing protein [Chloroflexota bacterium]
MSEVLWAVIGSLIMLVGFVGVFAPVLPGIPLAWLGFFLYALGTGFERISLTTAIVFTVLAVLVMGLDFLAPMLGARKYRASHYAVFGAFIGMLAGIIIFPPWGFIIGPFVGAFVVELLVKKHARPALGSALGTLVGFLAGTLVKTVFVLTMAGFLIAAWF